MIWRRAYSAPARKVFHGLKLIDYMLRPEMRPRMARLPRPGQALHAVGPGLLVRDAGDRIEAPGAVPGAAAGPHSSALGNGEAALEAAVVLVAQFRVADRHAQPPRTYRHLRSLLARRGLDADAEHAAYTAWRTGDAAQAGSAVGRVLAAAGVAPAALDAWVACFEAPTLGDALAAMRPAAAAAAAGPPPPWPAFLLLFTLNRAARTRREAYDALTLYQQTLPAAPPAAQPLLTLFALELAAQRVLEMVPPVCRTYVRHAAPAARRRAHVNELLWVLARFGSASFTPGDAVVLLSGQRELVDAVGIDGLDTKGLCAVAYVLRFKEPDTALALIENLPEAPERPAQLHASAQFAYNFGVLALRLLANPDADAVLRQLTALREAPPPRLWETVLMGWRNAGQLTPALAARVFDLWTAAGVKYTSKMVERVVAALDTAAGKRAVVEAARARLPALWVSPAAMLAQLGPREFRERLETATPRDNADPRRLAALLRAQARFDRPAAWATYAQLAAAAEPGSDDLAALCVAAWDPRVLWTAPTPANAAGERLPAPFVAAREVRARVRGLGSAPDDVTYVYPQLDLVYAYVFMLGTARDTAALSEVLPWLEAIRLRPSKRVLLALVHFSQEGPALLRLGAKAGPEWPSAAELEAYRHELESHRA